MNKKCYGAAIDKIRFSEGLDDKIAEYLAGHEKKRSHTGMLKIAGIATAAVIIAVMIFSLPNGGSYLDLTDLRGDANVKYVNDAPYIKNSADLEWLTEKELFNTHDTIIFKGTVTDIKNIEIDFNGSVEYRSIIKIRIEKMYRGEVDEKEVSVIAPAPIGTQVKVEDTDVISSIKTGTKGIFMPVRYSSASYREQNGVKVYWLDIAGYGFADGMRYAFLETKEGLNFEREAYPSIKKAVSLDEVEGFILDMIDS